MWITILETFAGPSGLYLKGLKYDLPETIVRQIRAKGRKLWQKTIAPWEYASICPDLRIPEQPPVQPAQQPAVPDEVN
jgi:hypothetical protein